MPIIHPTALVSPDAQLADDVVVGPWSIIEGGAIIGPGSRILAHAVITRYVTLGAHNEVGYGTVLGSGPQDIGFRQETPTHVIIGDGNIFHEYVTVHRGAQEGSCTHIGNNNFIMCGAHLGHNTRIGNHVIIANNCLLAGYVEVEDRANLGGGALFHQNIRVGKLAMVRGGTRIGKNLPPYLVASETNTVAGINAIGLRRSGMSVELRREITKAFQLVYRKNLNVTQALEQAAQERWSEEVRYFFNFIEHSRKRGICKGRKQGSLEEE